MENTAGVSKTHTFTQSIVTKTRYRSYPESARSTLKYPMNAPQEFVGGGSKIRIPATNGAQNSLRENLMALIYHPTLISQQLHKITLKGDSNIGNKNNYPLPFLTHIPNKMSANTLTASTQRYQYNIAMYLQVGYFKFIVAQHTTIRKT